MVSGPASLTPTQRDHARRVLALFAAARMLHHGTAGAGRELRREISAIRKGQIVTDGALLRVAAWCGVTQAELARTADRAGASDRRAAP